MKDYRTLWIALLVLAVLSPLGLYLPRLLGAGGAWGEWSLEELHQIVGYAPRGMRDLADLWRAPFQGYALPGQTDAPLARQSLAYVLSALLGTGVSAGLAYLLARWLARRSR